MAFPAFAFLGLLAKLKALIVGMATFVIDRWRFFLPLAMVLAVLWCIHSLRVQRDDARQELTDYMAEVERSMQTFALHNLQKEQAAAKALDQVDVDHQVQIELLRRSSDARYKDAQRDAAGNDAAWRERVRLELARNPAYGVPGLPGTASGSAESGGECNATDPGQTVERYIDALELGGAITTADYNKCIAGWTKACEIYGCK